MAMQDLAQESRHTVAAEGTEGASREAPTAAATDGSSREAPCPEVHVSVEVSVLATVKGPPAVSVVDPLLPPQGRN